MSDRIQLQEAAVYSALAIGSALALAVYADRLGPAVLPLTMVTPFLAVFFIRIVLVGDGMSPDAWRDTGIDRAGLRYWPLAAALPLAALVPGYLIVWGWTGGGPVLPDSTEVPRILIQLGFSLIVGTALGAMAEEIGWRGYLLPRLLQLGRWRAMFLTGFLHGIWHLPLLILTPYYHSEGSLWITLPLFVTTLTLAGGVYGHLRLAAASIWPVALAHRGLNLFWERLDAMTPEADRAALGYIAGESGLGVIVMLSLILLAIRHRQRHAAGSLDARS